MENMKTLFILLLVLLNPGCRSGMDEKASDEMEKTTNKLMEQLAALNVISSISDEKNKSQSVLYGNGIGLKNAVVNASKPGAVLILVSWRSKEDESWFGGIIPQEIKSVEILSSTVIDEKLALNYAMYTDGKLQRQVQLGREKVLDREKFILSIKAAVMP